MKKFNKKELVRFIRAIDRNLESPASIFLIGGAAASIAYDSGTKTSDLDIFNVIDGSSEDIVKASEIAFDETGLEVSVGVATVSDFPYNYEDRVKKVSGLNLDNLTIIVPDKYDLALSKTLRGYQHDIDAIEGIHRKHYLSMNTLVDRFEKELVGIAIADPRKTRLNMAMVVSQLYGFEEGRKLAERWGLPVPRSP